MRSFAPTLALVCVLGSLTIPSSARADVESCMGMMADGTCIPTMEPCECDDCWLVHPTCGGCDSSDPACTLDDACTCSDCLTEEYCSNPANCVDDGECRTIDEGCHCADCADFEGCVATPGCGDGTCDAAAGEPATCPEDCCGDGFCDPEEACAADCDAGTGTGSADGGSESGAAQDSGTTADSGGCEPACLDDEVCQAGVCTPSATVTSADDSTGTNEGASSGSPCACTTKPDHFGGSALLFAAFVARAGRARRRRAGLVSPS